MCSNFQRKQPCEWKIMSTIETEKLVIKTECLSKTSRKRDSKQSLIQLYIILIYNWRQSRKHQLHQQQNPALWVLFLMIHIIVDIVFSGLKLKYKNVCKVASCFSVNFYEIKWNCQVKIKHEDGLRRLFSILYWKFL